MAAARASSGSMQRNAGALTHASLGSPAYASIRTAQQNDYRGRTLTLPVYHPAWAGR